MWSSGSGVSGVVRRNTPSSWSVARSSEELAERSQKCAVFSLPDIELEREKRRVILAAPLRFIKVHVA